MLTCIMRGGRGARKNVKGERFYGQIGWNEKMMMEKERNGTLRGYIGGLRGGGIEREDVRGSWR